MSKYYACVKVKHKGQDLILPTLLKGVPNEYREFDTREEAEEYAKLVWGDIGLVQEVPE